LCAIFDKEPHTHTHTHTHRERERERERDHPKELRSGSDLNNSRPCGLK
jgi:hypothetical protein